MAATTNNVDEGVWLAITLTNGLLLGMVRLDDRNHQLHLKDIRDLIEPSLQKRISGTFEWKFVKATHTYHNVEYYALMRKDMEIRTPAATYLPSIAIKIMLS